MDDYIFRRELDLRTNLPEAIVQIKKSRQFRKMDLEKKEGLYDSIYALIKKHFLSGYISAEEKREIENAATQQILERARQEWEKTLQ